MALREEGKCDTGKPAQDSVDGVVARRRRGVTGGRGGMIRRGFLADGITTCGGSRGISMARRPRRRAMPAIMCVV